ncbi:hypothetical protein EJB05_33484, partial [Eragrostis curvula]
MNAAAVVIGGTVFWQARYAVASLCVATLEAKLKFLPFYRSHLIRSQKRWKNHLIMASPDRRLCVVDARLSDRELQVRLLIPDESGSTSGWKEAQKMFVCMIPGMAATRTPCEKSGMVLLLACFGGCYDQRNSLYVLDIEKKGVWLIPASVPQGFHGARELPRSTPYSVGCAEVNAAVINSPTLLVTDI